MTQSHPKEEDDGSGLVLIAATLLGLGVAAVAATASSATISGREPGGPQPPVDNSDSGGGDGSGDGTQPPDGGGQPPGDGSGNQPPNSDTTNDVYAAQVAGKVVDADIIFKNAMSALESLSISAWRDGYPGMLDNIYNRGDGCAVARLNTILAFLDSTPGDIHGAAEAHMRDLLTQLDAKYNEKMSWFNTVQTQGLDKLSDLQSWFTTLVRDYPGFAAKLDAAQKAACNSSLSPEVRAARLADWNVLISSSQFGSYVLSDPGVAVQLQAANSIPFVVLPMGMIDAVNSIAANLRGVGSVMYGYKSAYDTVMREWPEKDRLWQTIITAGVGLLPSNVPDKAVFYALPISSARAVAAEATRLKAYKDQRLNQLIANRADVAAQLADAKVMLTHMHNGYSASAWAASMGILLPTVFIDGSNIGTNPAFFTAWGSRSPLNIYDKFFGGSLRIIDGVEEVSAAAYGYAKGRGYPRSWEDSWNPSLVSGAFPIFYQQQIVNREATIADLDSQIASIKAQLGYV